MVRGLLPWCGLLLFPERPGTWRYICVIVDFSNTDSEITKGAAAYYYTRVCLCDLILFFVQRLNKAKQERGKRLEERSETSLLVFQGAPVCSHVTEVSYDPDRRKQNPVSWHYNAIWCKESHTDTQFKARVPGFTANLKKVVLIYKVGKTLPRYLG